MHVVSFHEKGNAYLSVFCSSLLEHHVLVCVAVSVMVVGSGLLVSGLTDVVPIRNSQMTVVIALSTLIHALPRLLLEHHVVGWCITTTSDIDLSTGYFCSSHQIGSLLALRALHLLEGHG